MMTNIQGCVFNIEHYAVHDGPGIRTLVFLKGCPLHCLWCCNPESQQSASEFLLFSEKCIGCGECAANCPAGAITLRSDNFVTDNRLCTHCHRCTDNCFSGARTLCGTMMDIEQVLSEIRKDIPFYRRSGGGITLSGGEPLLQADFAEALLRRCKQDGISTAVETCGFVPQDIFLRLMPLVDTYLFDLKHMDPATHRILTSVDNTLILQNFQTLMSNHKQVIPRIPLVPTLNDSNENLIATCRFLKQQSCESLNLLPYHELGVNKYARIGRAYPLRLTPHSPEVLRQKKKLVELEGIHCAIY